jgi:hypothetical protein
MQTVTQCRLCGINPAYGSPIKTEIFDRIEKIAACLACKMDIGEAVFTGEQVDNLSTSPYLQDAYRIFQQAEQMKMHPLTTSEPMVKEPRSNAVELAILTLAAIGILTIAALAGIGIASILHHGL